MKLKKLCIILGFFVLLSVTGCSKKTSSTEVDMEVQKKHKIVVVVADKLTKAPVKEAKVYVMGDNNVYTTDEMGKTPEIEVEVNKDYFERYNEEVTTKMGSGFINIAVVKDGYSKHIELDYAIYPGDFPSLAKVELSKNKKYTVNVNAPDQGYIENLLKAYEKFEGEGTKTENILKYKVAVVDDANKPIENAKIVIPEANLSALTDKKGICEFEIPADDSIRVNYPVKKEYCEMTILTYKEGYASKALLRVIANKDNSNNSMILKMKKSKNPRMECEIQKPNEKWVENLVNSYN